MSLKKSVATLILALGMGTAMALAGCQASKSATRSDGSEHKAVACSKCRTVYVSNPALAQKHVYYQPTKVMACPDCHFAVEEFFRTGKLKHHCDTCGGDMEPCEIHS